jgi:PIN domain nuclease of toxin-antitoxin system
MPKGDVGARAFLLDTHVWVWLMQGDPTLKRARAVLSTLEQAAMEARLLVAAISVWEVGMLESKGRIVLPIDVMQWVERALAAPGVRLQPLTPAIAVQSTRLPGGFHGDPADRILVATARDQDATLVTRDERILNYGATGLVSTLAV